MAERKWPQWVSCGDRVREGKVPQGPTSNMALMAKSALGQYLAANESGEVVGSEVGRSLKTWCDAEAQASPSNPLYGEMAEAAADPSQLWAAIEQALYEARFDAYALTWQNGAYCLLPDSRGMPSPRFQVRSQRTVWQRAFVTFQAALERMVARAAEIAKEELGREATNPGVQVGAAARGAMRHAIAQKCLRDLASVLERAKGGEPHVKSLLALWHLTSVLRTIEHKDLVLESGPQIVEVVTSLMESLLREVVRSFPSR